MAKGRRSVPQLRHLAAISISKRKPREAPLRQRRERAHNEAKKTVRNPSKLPAKPSQALGRRSRKTGRAAIFGFRITKSFPGSLARLYQDFQTDRSESLERTNKPRFSRTIIDQFPDILGQGHRPRSSAPPPICRAGPRTAGCFARNRLPQPLSEITPPSRQRISVPPTSAAWSVKPQARQRVAEIIRQTTV